MIGNLPIEGKPTRNGLVICFSAKAGELGKRQCLVCFRKFSCSGFRCMEVVNRELVKDLCQRTRLGIKGPGFDYVLDNFRAESLRHFVFDALASWVSKIESTT